MTADRFDSELGGEPVKSWGRTYVRMKKGTFSTTTVITYVGFELHASRFS